MSSERITSLDELSLEPAGKVFPSPADWRDQFIYFLLIDRFNDGKRRKKFDRNHPEKNSYDRDPSGGETFQGGNIKGITKRLDYIKDLGATALWISPVFKNRIEDDHSYHGYGIQNFLEVDPRFGTKDDLKKLVDESHKRGIYVILDIVINHTGNNWGYAGDSEPGFWHGGGKHDFGFWRKAPASKSSGGEELGPDDAVWPAEFQNPDWYKRRGRIGNWDNPEEFINGDFFGFKELDVRNPDAVNALIRSYGYWIAEYDIDGFRIDTVKHVSREATQAFASGIREFSERIGKKNFFLFGEIIGGDETIKSYVIPDQSLADGGGVSTLDASLDFPLYCTLEEVIKGFSDPANLSSRYDKLHALYEHSDVSNYFVTFVDNHDQMVRQYKRFLYQVSTPEQAVLAIGYLLTANGIPCLYYGTEQGFDGGSGDSDKYIRENMFGGEWGAFGTTGAHFFDKTHPLYKKISRVAETRKEEPALRYGRQYFRDITRDGEHFYFPKRDDLVLAYSRVLDSEEIIVVMNLANRVQEASVVIDHELADAGETFEDLLGKHKGVTTREHNQTLFIETSLAPFQICLFKKRII